MNKTLLIAFLVMGSNCQEEHQSLKGFDCESGHEQTFTVNERVCKKPPIIEKKKDLTHVLREPAGLVH